jgi:hypothetical protein
MRSVVPRTFAVLLSAAALAGVSAITYAQVATVQLKQTAPAQPEVLSGADIGFKVQGHRNGKPVGTLVVRENGEWREVEFASIVKLTK